MRWAGGGIPERRVRQEAPAAGGSTCRPISKNWPLCGLEDRRRLASERKCGSGSSTSTTSNRCMSRPLVTRPTPAAQSMALINARHFNTASDATRHDVHLLPLPPPARPCCARAVKNAALSTMSCACMCMSHMRMCCRALTYTRRNVDETTQHSVVGGGNSLPIRDAPVIPAQLR